MPRLSPQLHMRRDETRALLRARVARVHGSEHLKNMEAAVSATIREARRRARMRASDMAEIFGVSTATYSRWERGPGAMTVNQLVLVAGVLDIRSITTRFTE